MNYLYELCYKCFIYNEEYTQAETKKQRLNHKNNMIKYHNAIYDYIQSKLHNGIDLLKCEFDNHIRIDNRENPTRFTVNFRFLYHLSDTYSLIITENKYILKYSESSKIIMESNELDVLCNYIIDDICNVVIDSSVFEV